MNNVDVLMQDLRLSLFFSPFFFLLPPNFFFEVKLNSNSIKRLKLWRENKLHLKYIYMYIYFWFFWGVVAIWELQLKLLLLLYIFIYFPASLSKPPLISDYALNAYTPNILRIKFDNNKKKMENKNRYLSSPKKN